MDRGFLMVDQVSIMVIRKSTQRFRHGWAAVASLVRNMACPEMEALRPARSDALMEECQEFDDTRGAILVGEP
jgi:hypothetical protein